MSLCDEYRARPKTGKKDTFYWSEVFPPLPPQNLLRRFLEITLQGQKYHLRDNLAMSILRMFWHVFLGDFHANFRKYKMRFRQKIALNDTLGPCIRPVSDNSRPMYGISVVNFSWESCVGASNVGTFSNFPLQHTTVSA